MAGDDAVPDVGDLGGGGEADRPPVEGARSRRHGHVADEARAPVVADAVGHRAGTRRRSRGRHRTGGARGHVAGAGLDTALRRQHVERQGHRDRRGSPEIQMETGVANLEHECVRTAGGRQIRVRGVDEVPLGVDDDRAVRGPLGDRVLERVAVGVESGDRPGDDGVGLTGQDRIRRGRLVEEDPVDLPADQRQRRGDEVQPAGRSAQVLSGRHRAENRGHTGRDGGGGSSHRLAGFGGRDRRCGRRGRRGRCGRCRRARRGGQCREGRDGPRRRRQVDRGQVHRGFVQAGLRCRPVVLCRRSGGEIPGVGGAARTGHPGRRPGGGRAVGRALATPLVAGRGGRCGGRRGIVGRGQPRRGGDRAADAQSDGQGSDASDVPCRRGLVPDGVGCCEHGSLSGRGRRKIIGYIRSQKVDTTTRLSQFWLRM